MFRLSLRAKATVSAFLVLAPVLVLLIWNYRTAYDVQKKATVTDQVELAESVSTLLIDNVFDETLVLDRSYAMDADVLSLDPGRISNYLAPLPVLYYSFSTFALSARIMLPEQPEGMPRNGNRERQTLASSHGR
ncbi:MAG: hypothetical protein HYX94_10770 [Chloroflexi bacterium]|nr:hypothetical protein [Chloroflexota bacterium]